MTMRLQEIHPATVHFPIALLPVTLGADAVGRITHNRTLQQAGRFGIVLTAGSAVASAVAGVLAQEASRFDDEAHDVLVTHRTLNLGLVGLLTWLARRRVQRDTPGIGYLVGGLAGIGVMTYSAYLGGHLVYSHGVGVESAGNLRKEDAPELVAENLPEIASVVRRNLVRGVANAVRGLVRGEVAPWLRRSHAATHNEAVVDTQPEARLDYAAY